MDRYYISTGLHETDTQYFESDAEAWNSLRLLLPGKFATLMKRVEFKCRIVNPKNYINSFNCKYAKRPYGFGPDCVEPMDINTTEKNIVAYIPVLTGLTDDEYGKEGNGDEQD